MNQTRDHVIIRGRAVLHSTACRDWVCGECGSRLVTRYLGATPEWKWATICSQDKEHSPDNFIHKQSQAWREHEKLKEAATAQDIFRHLPQELQEAIGDE